MVRKRTVTFAQDASEPLKKRTLNNFAPLTFTTHKKPISIRKSVFLHTFPFSLLFGMLVLPLSLRFGMLVIPSVATSLRSRAYLHRVKLWFHHSEVLAEWSLSLRSKWSFLLRKKLLLLLITAIIWLLQREKLRGACGAVMRCPRRWSKDCHTDWACHSVSYRAQSSVSPHCECAKLSTTTYDKTLSLAPRLSWWRYKSKAPKDKPSGLYVLSYFLGCWPFCICIAP